MLRSWILPSLAALALAVTAALAVYDFAREKPVNVILMTVESWRLDSVTEQNMPHLVLESGPHAFKFTNHRNVSAWTGPNVISLLSGLSPFEQDVHTRGDSVPPELDVATEKFEREGWIVKGLQAFMMIDLFDNLGLDIESGVDIKHWLASRSRDFQPFYLWYHYLPTHLPYQQKFSSLEGLYFPAEEDAPLDPELAARIEAVATQPVIPAGSVAFEEADRRWIESAYWGGVRDFDEWFAEFWRFYRKLGLHETTILVLTSDHGEELLERGNVGHASTTRAGHLHEEIVRVPLYVWLPPHLKGGLDGATFAHPTDHSMIASALRRLVGLEDIPEARQSAGGQPPWLPPVDRDWTALSSIAGYAEPDPDDVTQFVAAATDGATKVQVGVTDGQIVNVEAWDIEGDPGEKTPLSVTEPAVERLTALLADKIASMPSRGEKQGAASAPSPQIVPKWVRPVASGQIDYDDIAGAAYITWSGDDAKRYIVAYEAGSGALALNGEIEVEGNRHDFGEIDKSYWATWILPYGQVRFRVREAESGPWSEWLKLELVE